MLIELILAAVGPGWPAQDPSVPKMETAAAQLQHAKAVRSESRGTRGAERLLRLEAALAAYAAVRDHWPDSGRVLAEAAFRRGELHRTLGQPGHARSAFLECLDAARESGESSVFPCRALLEIGHLHRRAGEFDQALASYRRARAEPGTMLRYQNDCREWIAEVHLDLGNWMEAGYAFREWAEHAEGPLEIVRATDGEALALLGAGEVELAQARVDQVVDAYEVLSADPTQEGEALRRALARMKAPQRIAELRAATGQ